VLSATLCVLFSNMGVWAKETPSAAQLLNSPPNIAAQQIEGQPIPNDLVPYKNDALGDRQPLVLVHGIGGTEGSRFYNWDNFLAYTDNNLAFQSRYKIYLFVYNSEKSVAFLSSQLQGALKDLVHDTRAVGSEKNYRIVAYSEGGLLVRNALQDPIANAHAEKVITIATPFHGSPLASPDWFKEQLVQDSVLSPVRISHKIAYWVAAKKHPSFIHDFQWDNFDGSIPAANYHPNDDAVNDYALEQKKNFITYGSFFGEEAAAADALTSELAIKEPLPKEKVKFKNLFRKNILFTYVNKTISKLPFGVPFKRREAGMVASAVVSDQEAAEIQENAQDTGITAVDKPGVPSLSTTPLPNDQTLVVSKLTPVQSIMPYNDGISPISSSLWLGRFTPNFSTVKDPMARVWAALKSLKGTQQARLFPGMDHRNWMDGETRTDSIQVRDLLNPDEKAKSVFDWILYDLMG